MAVSWTPLLESALDLLNDKQKDVQRSLTTQEKELNLRGVEARDYMLYLRRNQVSEAILMLKTPRTKMRAALDNQKISTDMREVEQKLASRLRRVEDLGNWRLARRIEALENEYKKYVKALRAPNQEQVQVKTEVDESEDGLFVSQVRDGSSEEGDEENEEG